MKFSKTFLTLSESMKNIRHLVNTMNEYSAPKNHNSFHSLREVSIDSWRFGSRPTSTHNFILYLTVESAAYKIIIRHALVIILPAHGRKLTSFLAVTQIKISLFGWWEKQAQNELHFHGSSTLIGFKEHDLFITINAAKLLLSKSESLSFHWKVDETFLQFYQDVNRSRFYRFHCRFSLRNCRQFLPETTQAETQSTVKWMRNIARTLWVKTSNYAINFSFRF